LPVIPLPDSRQIQIGGGVFQEFDIAAERHLIDVLKIRRSDKRSRQCHYQHANDNDKRTLELGCRNDFITAA